MLIYNLVIQGLYLKQFITDKKKIVKMKIMYNTGNVIFPVIIYIEMYFLIQNIQLYLIIHENQNASQCGSQQRLSHKYLNKQTFKITQEIKCHEE